MLLKSTFSIIGKIISQIRRATGIETFAYSSLPSASGTVGNRTPIATPSPIQIATQIVRYFAKNPIFLSAIRALLIAFILAIWQKDQKESIFN
jgi:hypothetical protein